MNIVGALRPLQVVSSLLKTGYTPIVLTTNPWDETINDHDFGGDIVEKIRIERIAFWPVRCVRKVRKAVLSRLYPLAERHSGQRFLSSFIQRLIGLFNILILLADSFFDVLLWSVGILFHGRRIAKASSIDCIFCTVPPSFSLVPASLLAWLTRTPLIVDFRDLWTLHEYHGSFENKKRSLWRRKFDDFLERRVLAHCSYVIYNTPTAKAIMDAKHPFCTGKSFAITNGITAQCGGKPCREQNNGRFHISHIGSLYADRNPADFFDGLRRWIDEKGEDFRTKVVVNFIGRGTDQIDRTASQYGLGGIVRTSEQKSKKELREIMAEADLFLLCLGYRDASKYVVPAKMYDYIGAGKPVIAFAPADGEVFKLMKKLGLEKNVVVASDAKKVPEILDREYNRYVSKRPGYSVPQKLREHYDYPFIAAQIQSIIKLAIDEKQR